MIKNIPNKYHSNLLLNTINLNHKNVFNFFYLPMDHLNNSNMGYAFINFIEAEHIKKFY